MIDLGLALAGGAAKGLSHLVIYEKLIDEGIIVSHLTGASAGAIMASMLAYGLEVKEIVSILGGKEFQKLINGKWRYFNWKCLIGRSSGMFKIEPIYRFFKSIFKDAKIEDMKPMKLGITSTNLHTGETVNHIEGELAEIVTKSITFPLIFTSLDGESYDGGIRENIPVNLCRKLGAERIIAIDLKKTISTGSLNYQKRFTSLIKRIYELMWNGAIDDDIASSDLIINPIVNLGFFDFDRYDYVKRCIDKYLDVDEIFKMIYEWNEEKKNLQL